MKPLFTLLIFGLLTTGLMAQSKYAKDVESIDSIIEALYASISGEKGEARDWDRFRNLFIPEARLIPTGKNQEGKLVYNVSTPEQFVQQAGDNFVNNGFYEYETNRSTQDYGHVVHLFSTYASKRSKNDAEPFNTGINSIQLFNDGDRWWVVTIYWAHNTEYNPVPEKYKAKDKKRGRSY